MSRTWVRTSGEHLFQIYRRLIGRAYIALARQDKIYRNISDALGRLRSDKRYFQDFQLISVLEVGFYFSQEFWNQNVEPNSSSHLLYNTHLDSKLPYKHLYCHMLEHTHISRRLCFRRDHIYEVLNAGIKIVSVPAFLQQFRL